MCVSTVGAAVGAERQGHGGVEDAKLADHLLHAAYGPLFIGVSELYHQTRRSSLRETHEQLNITVTMQGHSSVRGILD